MNGCLGLGEDYILAGLTQGNVCLCGKSGTGESEKTMSKLFQNTKVEVSQGLGQAGPLVTYSHVKYKQQRHFWNKVSMDWLLWCVEQIFKKCYGMDSWAGQ
jgi:hypothetical protein